MEQDVDVFCTEVPKGRGVSGNALFDAIRTGACDAFRAKALAAFADAKAQAIGAAKVMVVAGAAGDISVARQDLVIEQKLTDFGFLRIKGDEVIVVKWPWKIRCGRGQSDAKGKDMKQAIHGVILAGAAMLATPVWAEIETARDHMEAGRFAGSHGGIPACSAVGKRGCRGINRGDVRAWAWG